MSQAPTPVERELVRFSHIHRYLSVSRDTVYHWSRTDSEFPHVIDNGPRTKLVSMAELRTYARRLVERSRNGEKLPGMPDKRITAKAAA
ncbi:hypothetical protein R0137_09750 [Congregibacter brevis]|uniref:Helix-turn-helix domain-containing protein n=1 Tax=Congregibacter brevis TaxID=3081201 RepID=A0ABZ0I8Y0_9GAMM|nr:hypothetical protein R0137_09750 [Congregibacter sp. IMCC45268]